MERYSLPLRSNGLAVFDLPILLEQRLIQANQKPSELFRAGWQLNESQSEEVAWFLDYLDRNCTISEIATIGDQGVFFILDGIAPKVTHRVFLPACGNITHPIERLPPRHALVVQILYRSFDSTDPNRMPFSAAGTAAAEFVDFTRPDASEGKSRWYDSVVLYSSVGGDSLLADKEGNVAWHQLETNRIIVAGEFENSVKQYFEFMWSGKEFSSWAND